MIDMNRNTLGFTLLVSAALLTPAAASEPAGAKTNAFFAFCIDTHDAKKRNLEQQAALLKELGYDGVGHLWLDNIPERLKTLDAAGLRLFQITMSVDITPRQAGLRSEIQGGHAASQRARRAVPVADEGAETFRPRRRCAGRGDHPRDGRPGPRIGRPDTAVSAQLYVAGTDRGRRRRGGQGGPPERRA